jgi:hypothetical protein
MATPGLFMPKSASKHPSGNAQGDTTERRTFVRYEFLSGLPAGFLKRPDLMAGIGLLKNVSARSIGLLTEEPLTPGTALVLRLPGRSAGGG